MDKVTPKIWLIALVTFTVTFGWTHSVWGKRVTQGTIISGSALIYQAPDFDAEPIAQLKKGQKVRVINRRYNMAFFKVELPSKKIGYVLDLDIDFEGKAPLPPGPLLDSDPSKDSQILDPFLDASSYQGGPDASQNGHNENFEWERLFGLRNHLLSYREKTMGRERRENISAFGLVWRGPDWIDFAAYTDLGLSFTTQAPDFYTQSLGYKPSGFNSWGYMLFMTSSALSSRSQMVYGFGPFLRTSSWKLTANTVDGVRQFDVTDMKLGGMGSWGVAYRLKSFAVRADFQFWWETSQYTSLAIAVEVPFPK